MTVIRQHASNWQDAAARFARLALDCVHREFPNHPLVVMTGSEDVRTPREHTPAFFGCFDWHSAVHGHWTLVRLARFFPEEAWTAEAVSALQRSLTVENLQLELKFVSKPGREGFERPYGLAWLLQLAIELQEWSHPEAAAMSAAIRPLEQHCRNAMASWLPKLTHPIRSGEHSQTAFAMGLAFDWALGTGDPEFAELLRRRSFDFYGRDVDLPLRFEPSGHDFLSSSLGEADLMRRVLPRGEFASWLDAALPFAKASGGCKPPEFSRKRETAGASDSPRESDIPRGRVDPRTRGADTPRSPWVPVVTADRADGKLAHLDGLNLSRAWMLEGIASALADDDPRKTAFEQLAADHAAAGLASVTGEHYAGGHWLGTFAVYLMTGRGFTSAAV